MQLAYAYCLSTPFERMIWFFSPSLSLSITSNQTLSIPSRLLGIDSVLRTLAGGGVSNVTKHLLVPTAVLSMWLVRDGTVRRTLSNLLTN